MMRKVISICDVCRKIDTHKESLEPIRYVHPITGKTTVKACGSCQDAVADVINEISIEAEESEF